MTKPVTKVALSTPRPNPPPYPRRVEPRSIKPRVLFLLKEYPMIGQTYIKNEIEALEADYEIGILTRRRAKLAYANSRPHCFAIEMEEFVAQVELFKPDVLHTHYLTELAFTGELSRRTGVPFTVRTHSCDTIGLRRKNLGDRLRQMMRGEPPAERAAWFTEGLRAMDSELCLGVLVLPCARPWMVRTGVNQAKLIDCFPVVRFAAFHDPSPNGDAVMNIGGAAEKKAMPDFLRLAKKVSGRAFNLYALGAKTDWLEKQIAGNGARVNVVAPVEPEDMPAEYKKHRWLVYTGDVGTPSAGWPMAIAEAQAAGVGVCMPMLRPDLAQYIGEGAGILYDTIDELPAIVSAPVPEEMRERGFQQARKSDIERHKHLLTDLWDDAICGRTPGYREQEEAAAETSAVPAPMPATRRVTGAVTSSANPA